VYSGGSPGADRVIYDETGDVCGKRHLTIFSSAALKGFDHKPASLILELREATDS